MNTNILLILLIEVVGLIAFYILYKKNEMSLKRFKVEMIFLVEALVLNLSVYYNKEMLFIIMFIIIILTRIYIGKNIPMK